MASRLLAFMAFLTLSAPAFEAKVRSSDAFMSSIDMKNLFRLEVAMVDVLRKQKEQLEAGLQSIRGYVQEGKKRPLKAFIGLISCVALVSLI